MLRPSARPTASFGPAKNLERDFYEAPPEPLVTSLPPIAAPRRPRSGVRSVFAKILFVVLFAAVATLLGLALKKKFDRGSLAPKNLVGLLNTR